MKLIVQSDDYGITRAGAQGCLHGIRNGLVKNTGIFTNMPWCEEVAEWIRPYQEQVALGIDLNLSTGSSVLPHEQIPDITQEDGSFLTSRMNRALDTDENDHDHLREYRDQVYAEFKAQIEKFIRIFGKKPDYIHNHAYGTPTTAEVTETLGKEYNLLSSAGLMEIPEVYAPGMEWYGYGDRQLESDLKSFILDHLEEIKKHPYTYLITHCGYVDNDLMNLSSFNLCRVKDLEALCDPEVIQAIKDNGIELIDYRDLPESFKN